MKLKEVHPGKPAKLGEVPVTIIQLEKPGPSGTLRRVRVMEQPGGRVSDRVVPTLLVSPRVLKPLV